MIVYFATIALLGANQIWQNPDILWALNPYYAVMFFVSDGAVAFLALGAVVLAHGVAISPGKPTILASLFGKPVIGLPGQVTSAQVVLDVFGLPLLAHLAGDRAAYDRAPRTFPALLSRNVASKQGREDHVRVRLEPRPGELPLAHPVLGKSGLLKTLLMADGLIVIPADLEGLAGQAVVAVRPI